MWQDRLKGLSIIIISALVSLGLIRYFVNHQAEITQGLSQLTPEKVEKKILGVVNQIGKKKDNQEKSSGTDLAVEIVEKKASELLKEIKDLPQEQLEVLKRRLLFQLCQELMVTDSRQEASQEGTGN